MKEKLCVRFLIPLKYNDGKDIEPEKFNEVREELLKKFCGFSIYPFSIEGGWVDPDNKSVYFDRTKQFEVTVDHTKENESFFNKYKERLKEKFKQKQIYMICTIIFQI